MSDTTNQTITARSALHARQRPDVVALVAEGREVTYAELHRESNRTAHALLRAGLGRGARVAYIGKESEHYYELAVACAKSGTVLVPVNWRLAKGEVDHVLRDSQAEILFFEREFLRVVQRVRDDLPTLRTAIGMDTAEERAAGFLAWKSGAPDTDLEPGDTEEPIAQMYTSGTTGLPKGVVLPHRSFFTFIDNMRRHGVDWIDWRPEDRSLTCFPGLHAGGYAWFMHCFNVGATSVVMRMFVAEEAVRLIRDEAVTTVWAAPAMLQMMLDEPAASPEAFRSLRKIVYGGSPIDYELMVRCVKEFGCELSQAYASAETGSFVTCLRPDEHVPGSPLMASAGRVCPGNEVKIVDDEGNTLPPGRIGRICLRSPARFTEYWRQPEASRKMIRGDWLYMSDAGYLDENGYLFLRDRINDTIIVAGQNIYPVEIENAIREHPGVADVAVFGVSDPRWGEVVRAAVVRRPGHEEPTERQLMVFLRGRIADYKIPNGYVFLDSLPRNPTGKVLRRVLREEYASSPPRTTANRQP
ncbi:long-chain-fatty-acid--CoA ligase [Streptomyces sp. DH37]|uniref:long-chain-fatty-acid--CoA ligase n=1 Tax=Streptomyces sp. DH37 TaxID=3040122 RepID=UPI0024416786|nr:long-chain-fatty-acid--CoA ligase [Streptomyces sp. DH37]MDG9703217.1 long-chain-fatty-acid--CoA ligase [Streptomyces sp. DH37]